MISTPSATKTAQQTPRFRQLSPPKQTLVRLLQTVNFGQLRDLEVRDGEPVFNPAPLVQVDVKLDAEEGPRPEQELTDFTLRSEVARLMDRLREIGNGTVERIEICAGVPRRMIVEVRPQGVLR